MKTLTRIAAGVSVCVALLGITSIMGQVRPLPPPPVLCSCLCPDGSLIITHAPNGNACKPACTAACAAGGQES